MSTLSEKFSLCSFKGKPTILQVLPRLGVGGVEIGTLVIAEAIVKAGGRALIASNMNNISIDNLPVGVEFKNLPLDTKNPFYISKNARLLKKLIQKENVDIVHVRSRAPAWSAYKAARSASVPFVTTYHAAYHSQTVFKTFYNSVMAKGDRVIAISQFISDHIIEKYQSYSWFDPSKIRLIQRGVDLHYFDPSSITKERVHHVRENWDIPPDMRLLLLPGRMSRNKGQELMINALSLMKHANVMLVFVGSAQGHESFRDDLLRYTTTLDLEGRVKWMPPCSDLPAAYQLADVIVCPSLVPEGFGRIMAEAQAMKKPIVSSDHGAAREVIEHGITGWRTSPHDANALAKALDDALDLPSAELHAMGEKGRERVQDQFSKEAMCFKTIETYKELLK